MRDLNEGFWMRDLELGPLLQRQGAWAPDNDFPGSSLRYERLSVYEVCGTYG
jgi:hypothetical protein